VKNASASAVSAPAVSRSRKSDTEGRIAGAPTRRSRAPSPFASPNASALPKTAVPVVDDVKVWSASGEVGGSRTPVGRDSIVGGGRTRHPSSRRDEEVGVSVGVHVGDVEGGGEYE
jgi:hypothetical protein